MSTTNELFNSFCLALREDLKHRKRNPYKPGGGLLRAGDRGDVRGATRAAQDYAHAFNTAAYKLRGFYPSDTINTRTIEDVGRMVRHFNAQYVRMMEHGVSPAITADALTHQWWDHLSDKANKNPSRKRQAADINGIVADIEVQADEAVARIQAMATTDTGTLRFFEFELEEFVDDAMNDNIDPLVIKRALCQQAAVLDLLIEEGGRLRDSNDTEEQS